MDQIDTSRLELQRPEREPMFNAPWTLVVLCVGLIGLYALQAALMTDAQLEGLALTPRALLAGRWQTLLTSLFLHGSWPHVLMNSVAILAFGPPAARLMGGGPRGAAAFFAFYLVCGVLAGLGFVLCDPGDVQPVVGASGAVSGLFGAAARLIQGRGRVGPLVGPTVIGMTTAWVVVNVIFGLLPIEMPGAMGMPIAWQAHLAGYAAGLLLIGPFARLAGPAEVSITQ